jgi:hypothetical protein
MKFTEMHELLSSGMFDGLFLSRKHRLPNNKIALKLKFKAKFKPTHTPARSFEVQLAIRRK